jgi:hypothetical protein
MKPGRRVNAPWHGTQTLEVRMHPESTCSYCGSAFRPYRENRPQPYCSVRCAGLGKRVPVADRLWARVARGEGCWEWQGPRSSGGYGRISIGRRTCSTHRVAWEITHGPIPDGMYVLHHCDNPPCCRPDHLFLGTLSDNMQDAVRKGRFVSPNRKLTAEQVQEVRDNPHIGVVEFGKRFGVCPSTIVWIRKGRTHRYDRGRAVQRSVPT